jgi:hypothetical protein
VHLLGMGISPSFHRVFLVNSFLLSSHSSLSVREEHAAHSNNSKINQIF